MPRFEPDPALADLGRALSVLRRARGLSQADAGARLGMTSQGWGLYEAGRRPGLYRPDVQRRLTGALDATVEALRLALETPRAPSPADPAASGVESRSRTFADSPPAVSRRLVVRTGDVRPWAEPGVTLTFTPGAKPRPGQGCVFALGDGGLKVRVCDTVDAEGLTLRGGAKGLETITRLAWNEVVWVGAVTLREEAP